MRLGSGSFEDAVQIAHQVDKEVVEKVHDDGRYQPVFEEQVEHEHTDEPAIYKADQAQVFMPVSEFGIGNDNGRTQGPVVGVADLFLEDVHGEEVGYGRDDMQMDYFY